MSRKASSMQEAWFAWTLELSGVYGVFVDKWLSGTGADSRYEEECLRMWEA